MASSSTRRIFPITDWAPAHEALYPEADNDSSIDTLPFPTKARGSASVSVSAADSTASPNGPSPSSSSSAVAPPVRRSNTKKHRSMSLPWRPRSILHVDELEARVRDLSLQGSNSHADVDAHHAATAIDGHAIPAAPTFGNWAGFDVGADQATRSNTPVDGAAVATYAKGKGKKSIGGLWRRASVQIKGLVNINRRISIATETLGKHGQELGPDDLSASSKRQLRSIHSPSRSHHLFSTHTALALASPSPAPSPSPSPSACPVSPTTASPRSSPPQHQHHPQSSRPGTSHTINATWHRLRKATSTSFRNSRILYGDFSLATPENPDVLHSDLSTVPRPGVGNEPPVIPRNSGSGARAAVAAWQHDMFPTVHPLKNKRLTLDSFQNDRESGIGIAATIPDSSIDGLQDLDMVTAEGDVVLGGCAPSRVDFVYRLPVELAIHVLAHLDAAGLATASLVSTTWRDIASLQHIWRESYLREKTGTFATSEPITPGTGLGVPAILPGIDWKHAYRATEELGKRWKQGKATSIYLNGHSDSIYCLQFDEHKIITGSRDKTIRIWDMHTMACKLVIGPPEVVKDNALLYDDEGNPTHTANYEPHTGVDSRRNKTTSVPTTVSFQTHHKASILCLQYDENILVTGSSDSTCIVYDMNGGYRPIRRLRHHTAAVLDLCFDDKHIVTCSKDISICVWDRETGALLKQLRGHSGPVNAVQMRGNTIVSCSGDFRVKLWNIETGKQIREFQGHTKGLACSQFSEDGRYVASAGNDKIIRIWDANTGECLREMRAHESLVRSLHIDSVSGRLVSGSYDTDIKVFDMESGRQLLDFPRWHASWVLSAKSDYRRIVSTGQDPKILVMDFGAGIPGIGLLESSSGKEEVRPTLDPYVAFEDPQDAFEGFI